MLDHSLKRTRKLLDARLKPLKPEEQFKAPPRGWVKAVRYALGMTGVQFAARLGVRPQTVEALEKSEKNGTIQLTTLNRAAEALDCTLVYALVPKTSLDHNIDERAKKIALEYISKVSHTMKLEDQNITNQNITQQIEEYIWKYVSEKDIWNNKK
jgi:predicted DNA-binding mobile mystery protein A